LKLNIALIGTSFFYTINRVALKLFEVLSLWILVFLLPKEDIALIGISVGFISILNILNLSPYRRIFKSYEQIKDRLNDHVSAYILFWGLKSIAMFLLAIIAGIFYITIGYPQELFIVLNGLVLAYLFGNLQLLMQEVFFVKFKQKTATLFNVLSMIVFLASLLLLVLYPSVEFYVTLIVLKAVITAAGFIVLSKTDIGFIFSVSRDAKKLVEDAIREFAIYDHVIGASIELVSKVFLFVLGFFVVKAVVGDYTIALSLVNFLTFFPLIIYRTTMLAITRTSTVEGLEKVLSAFTKYAVIFSAIQYVVFLLVLKFIINNVVHDGVGDIWIYAAMLGLGVTVFSAGQPIHAVALLRADISEYFNKIILPITGIAVVGYVIAAYFSQPIFTGVIFISAAIIINVLAYLHIKKHAKVRIRKQFIYPEEKEAIRHLLAKIGVVEKNKA